MWMRNKHVAQGEADASPVVSEKQGERQVSPSLEQQAHGLGPSHPHS